MAVPEQNGRQLKEVFSKSKKEFEEEIRRDTLDMWSGMEVFLDQDDTASFNDWTSIDLSNETPSTTSSEKETTIKPLKKGPTMSPLEKGTHLKPLEKGPTLKPLDKKPAFRISERWSPVVRSVSSINEWPLDSKHVNRNLDWDWPKYNYKFVFDHPTPPSLTSAAHTSAVVMKLIGGAVGAFVALLIIIILLDKENRTRRGIVLTARAAGREILTDRRPSDAGAPEPLKTDLPPPYYECTPYNMNNYVDGVPPPYSAIEDDVSQDHKPRQNAFIENELRACSADDAPDMRTELVFANGRIVERLSLNLNSNKNETGAASNDNVEERFPDLKRSCVC